MATNSIQLPDNLRQELLKLRGRLRGLAVASGVGITLVVAAVLLVVALGVDWMWDLPLTVRVSMLWAGIGVTIVTGLWTILRPLMRNIELNELAALVENANPELQERLLTAVELSRSDVEEGEVGSAIMREWMLKETLSQTKEIDFGEAADSRPAMRRCWMGSAALLAMVLPMIFATNAYALLLSRFFNPWGNYERLDNLILEVVEGDRM
ncbi:MAG: hypothetical protein KDA88_17945, partial [Planctomycetaceae bacterium]|nr:hypothetical protein [Planctomycetaceae bacterium]